MPLEKLWLLQPTLEHHWGDNDSTHTHRAIMLNTVASVTVWNDQILEHQAASGQVSVNSAFTLSLLLSNAYHFCSSNSWVLRHNYMHALDMITIIVFVYLGFQYKWNQLSSNNSRYYSCIHKGLHAGKRHDLMTSKPDALSRVGYHWTDYTGITLADAIARWSSSGNPVSICIIGRHTGRPLGSQIHWNTTGTTMAHASNQWYSSGDPVLICLTGTHWRTPGRNWKHTGYQHISSGIPVYTEV